MRLAAVEVIPYSLPFAKPYVTARGRLDRREMVLVRARTDDGLEGLGEAVPLTLRGGSTLEAVVDELRGAAAELEGAELADPAGSGLPTVSTDLSPPAAAALEMALMDLAARETDRPLWRILGAPAFAPVSCNATLSAGSPEQVAAEAEDWAGRGFSSFKLKVGVHADVAEVEAVREALGPEPRIRIDANGAWSADEAIERLAAMKDQAIELAEQPAGTLDELAAVRAVSSVPIAADESVASPDDAARAAETRACDLATVKLSKVGGLGPARAIASILPTYLSSALDGPVGIAAAAHLAQVVDPGGRRGLAHGLATQLLFSETVARVECEVRDGQLHLPPGPGLGVVIDDAALKRARL
jgi:o-succinylbenzoate synthase